MKKIYYLLLPLVAFAFQACNDDDEYPDIDLDIDKKDLEYTKAGGDLAVNIVSSKEWTITIQDTEWLTASTLKGEGSAKVTFTADPYRETTERKNHITIKTETSTKEINVIQDASEPILEVSEQTLSYNYKGGTDMLEITANTSWELIIDDKDDWVTFDETEGEGDGEVILSVPEYMGEENRSATVILKSVAGEKEIKISQTFANTVGVWIMSEAGAMVGGADLAYYDYMTDELKTKYYSEINGEGLGTVANHALVYGSKMYIAMSGPANGEDGKIRVVDHKTGRLLETIPMRGPHGEGDLARQIESHDGKIYVTSYFGGGKGEEGSGYLYYGGVSKIDTTSLNIEAYIRVGDKPEGILYHNGKLLVCINESGNGNTMAIVDVEKFELERTVEVPENPMYLKKAPNGDIYLSTWEIWTGPNAGTPSAVHQVDPVTYSVNSTLFAGTPAYRFSVDDNYLYTGDFSWSSMEDVVRRLDRRTGNVQDIDIDHSFFMIYSIDLNPFNGDIYMGGQGQDVIFLDRDLQKTKTFKVGVPYINQFIPVFE